LRSVLKKLLSPGLEKALVFLDERLLGATSNAVERGKRRYRKMQKTVYRVRGAGWPAERAVPGRLRAELEVPAVLDVGPDPADRDAELLADFEGDTRLEPPILLAGRLAGQSCSPGHG
jgi:hypothetical protein